MKSFLEKERDSEKRFGGNLAVAEGRKKKKKMMMMMKVATRE